MAGISEVGCVLVQSLFFSSFLFQFCSALDAVRIGQSIRDGQTVISPQEVFVLGFFSPGSSEKRYVGIWYKKIPVQTVVWVANRENPLTDRSGVLKVREDGNLVVIDGRNNTLWSTNVSFSSSEPTAKLLDSGNLALMKGNNDDPEKAPWKSFDHPCDSFLPGMEIGIDVNRHLNILTNSWKSPDDPSPGDFTVGVDPYGSPQLFVWKKKMKYWRIGQWNGQAFIGVPDVVNDQTSRVDLVEENRFRYTKKTNSTARFLINSRGQQQLVQWDEQSKDWIERSSHPINQCEIYGHCGPNGHCNASSSPICRCLPGFEPKSLPDWNSRNWSSGCFRRTQLQCEMNDSYADSGDADGFWELTGMKLPDYNGLLSGIADLNECTNECKKNCSCTACAVVQGIGCMIWSEGLMDIEELIRYGQALHIRLAGSEIKKLLLEQQSERQTSNAKGRKHLLVVILVVCVLGAVMFVAGTYFLWRWRLRQRDRREAAKYFSEENNLGEDRIHGKGSSLPLFDLGTIVAATENFSAANKLGEGGFGPVYKGKLPWGEEIAVKKLSRSSDQGVEEFKNEVILISKLQHRNLVRFIGCCIQGEEKLLFYEFMPNKSLDTFIFDLDKSALLDWRKRFQISEGIARGLLYLHRDSRLKIIHRDLKASNILLDSEMNPKISDFGMARIFGGNQTEENTNRVMGTYGYMSPEYAMQGLFSEKSDVFSFGVLLLEIVSGKRNNSFCHFEHTLNLMGFAWHLWNEGKGMELMDPVLADSCSMNEVLRCIHVGLLCVQDAAIDRPTMPSVVSMLGSEIANLPTPKHPAFSINRSLLETSSSSKNQGMCSTNNVTITMINGR